MAGDKTFTTGGGTQKKKTEQKKKYVRNHQYTDLSVFSSIYEVTLDTGKDEKIPVILVEPCSMHYANVAELIADVIEKEEQLSSTKKNIQINISFYEKGCNRTLTYILPINSDQKFDYNQLDDPVFFTYGSPPSMSTASQRQTELAKLIRKYEPSLLLLKLSIQEYKKNQTTKAKNASAVTAPHTENITDLLSKKPGQPGILTSKNNVDPDAVVDYIMTALRTNQSPDRNEFVTFFNGTQRLYFTNFISKFSSLDLLTKDFLGEFIFSLAKLFNIYTIKENTFSATSTTIPPQKNLKIEKIMQSEAYKKLIERVDIIHNRKNENASTYKTDLLKMQSILSIEGAFEKALYEKDDKVAFEAIKKAISQNQENISAYSGLFSEGFFSFFHRDCNGVKKFFSHGYKSTSDELVDVLSQEVSKASCSFSAEL